MTRDKRMLDRLGESKRQVLVSLLVIGLISLGLGTGTYAYFSDSEVSSGNTFSAGTLDLKIKDGGDSWSDGIGTEWTLSNMKPGGAEEYGSVDFLNDGSI